ncbi:glycosyltransferase [Actinopolymorpha pittospori]|uniref:Glycosyltransferase involved in cell wall biosynthesis n=1 Tax=Actinopolymorpha pittospori TaxID=648752 RepID=A0A927N3N2_9ACTN|nr:glycosyltransferase involved in cell wall biosynthesis [Actinopolymorpha pittospori]
MKLSILVPVYNEVSTFDQVLKRILDVDYPCELEVVVVDDGSRDGTSELLDKIDDPRVAVHRHDVNRGKGAAIRTAATLATGTHMTICDADLEYDPDDIPKLLAPVIAGDSEVVYGTRTFSSHTSYSFWFVLGNRGVTTFANMLFNCYIRDLETCFKLMPLPLYRSLEVRSAGFGMEAEVTGKLLRLGYRPFEVPISYRARSRAEGKKLTWRDGVEALWILSRIRLFGRA